MRQAPLQLVLELLRTQRVGDPYGFEVTSAQEYALRREGGRYSSSASFPWSDSVLASLGELSSSTARGAQQRVGGLLSDFLDRLGWQPEESAILEAVRSGRPIRIVFRSAAAELYALPWELVPLKPSGQLLGHIPDCLIQYEWPGIRRAGVAKPATTGRILFAWSGSVPAPEHGSAIANASQRAGRPFDRARDVLAQVTLERLSLEIERSPEPIAVLHLLCHGAEAEPQVLGLRLDDERPVGVDAIGRALGPHAPRIERLVLCACQSGDAIVPSQRLGGIAQTLHRLGIPAVVASRSLLSAEGSIELAQAFYSALLVSGAPVPEAVLAARRRLELVDRGDWAALQLYWIDPGGDPVRRSRQVFVSHAPSDAGAAERIAGQLRRGGLDVLPTYLDGESRVDWLTEGLGRADYVLLLCSRAAKADPLFERSWKATLTARQEVVLLPVQLEPGAEAPFLLRDRGFDCASSFEGGMERLARFFDRERASPAPLVHGRTPLLSGLSREVIRKVALGCLDQERFHAFLGEAGLEDGELGEELGEQLVTLLHDDQYEGSMELLLEHLEAEYGDQVARCLDALRA